MLLAYLVSHFPAVDGDFQENVLVYHQNEAGARKIGRQYLSTGPSMAETIAERAPQYDDAAAKRKRAGVEQNPARLREMGWRIEGESSCGTCGLHPFGIAKYGVCRVTHQCKECGCDGLLEGENGPCTHEEGFSCG